MSDGDAPKSDRGHRRRRSRREVQRRRRLRLRRLVLAAGVGALLVLAVAAIPRGDDAPEASAPQPTRHKHVSALERSIRTREQQQQAVNRVLAYTPFLKQGRPRKREVALTFDDGPGPYTSQILHVLHRHDTPATFFLLGLMFDDFAPLARREVRQGHAVGSHTYDHPHMGELGLGAQIDELNRAEDAIESHGLPRPRLFRPPYGSFNSDTVDLLAHRGNLMVLWSVDTGDYLDPGADVIAQRALDGAEPGAVILMHDAGGDRSQTVEALPKIIRGLERRHLRPVTVPELLLDDPPPRGQSLSATSGISTEGGDAPLPAQPSN